jgi:hypothetical protein
MFTHIQAIDLFRQFAQKHFQVNSMGVGDYPEIGAERLLLGVDPANDNKIIYPLLWVVPSDATIDGKQSLIKYHVLIMDIVNDSNNNLQDVLNDTWLIHNDLSAALRDPALARNYIIDGTITLKPFTDKFDDAVAGWDAEVAFRISNLKDRCAAVMSGGLVIIENTLVT